MSGRGKFLYDSDVLIDFLRGEEKAKSVLFSSANKQCISVITVSELYAGIRSDKEEVVIKGLVDYFQVLEINKEIGRLAGLYKKQYYKSHQVVLPDALIAATAEYFCLELKTLSIKHYPMIKAIKPAYLKG